MKGMIRKELCVIGNNKKFLIICLTVYVVYSVLFDMDMSFFLPFMAAMLSITSFSYDDYNNWQTYASSLPQGRISIINAKYIVSFASTFTGAVLAVIFAYLGSLIKGKTFDPELTISFVLGCLFAVCIILAILFPVMFKYGGEKGRMAMIIIGLGCSGVVFILARFIDITPSEGLLTFLETYLPVLALVILVIMVTASYFISRNIYLKREF